MYKALITFLALVWIAPHLPGNNSLTNTKWQGLLNTGSGPMNSEFHFVADTLFVYVDGSIIASQMYAVNGDTLRFNNRMSNTGDAPCDDKDTGYYKFSTENDVLTISLLKDSCYNRSNAFTPDGYKKMESSGR